MKPIKNFRKIFEYYCHHPSLIGTYAGDMYSHFKLLEDPNHEFLHNENQLLIGYRVPKNVCNFNGVVHGGAFATLVDITTTLAIMKIDPELRKTVTIELSESCMTPSNYHDNLIIRAECIRLGKSVAFTECKIVQEKTHKMVVSGRQVKAVLDSPWDPEMLNIMNK